MLHAACTGLYVFSGHISQYITVYVLVDSSAVNYQDGAVKGPLGGNKRLSVSTEQTAMVGVS